MVYWKPGIVQYQRLQSILIHCWSTAMNIASTMLAAVLYSIRCTGHESPLESQVSCIPVPNWEEYSKKWNLVMYVQFVNVSREMQMPRALDSVEIRFLREAFKDLQTIETINHLDAGVLATVDKHGVYDFVRHEEIIASAKSLIKTRLGLPLVRSKSEYEADTEMPAKFVDTFQVCLSVNPASHEWLRTCLSVVMEDFPCRQLTMIPQDFFKTYISHMMRAAATNDDYSQLCTIMKVVKIDEQAAAKVVASSIARGGSVKIFKKAFKSSQQSFEHKGFYLTLIKLNKKELFQEYLRKLKTGNEQAYLKMLKTLFWYCCIYQRPDLVQVFLVEASRVLLQLDLSECLANLIENDKSDQLTIIFQALENAWARRSSRAVRQRTVWTPSDMTIGRLLDLGLDLGRFKMIRTIVWTESPLQITEAHLHTALCTVIKKGHVGAIKFLLGKGKERKHLITNLGLDYEDGSTLVAIGASDNINVLQFFVRRSEKGDPRFREFRVGMRENKIFCTACSEGSYDLVKYLLRRNEETGEMVFPDVDPAARNNMPLVYAIKHLNIVQELLRQDDNGAMSYPGVAVTADVLMAASRGPLDVFEFILQTVIDKDGIIRYKFPEIDITVNDHALLMALTRRQDVAKLQFMKRCDEKGRYILPGMLIPVNILAMSFAK